MMQRLLLMAAVCLLWSTGTATECGNEDGSCEAVSLLQARKVRPEVAVPPEHFIQFDGSTRTPVPRVELEEPGFVREVLIKYPLDRNPIEVSGTTAHISFEGVLEGEFVRNAALLDEQDYGIEKAMAFVGLQSLISDRVKLTFAEKSQTLWMPETVSSFTADRLKEIEEKQTWIQREKASMKRKPRTAALALLGMQVGVQIIGTGKDLKHVEAVRKFVADNGAVPEAQLQKKAQGANEELVRRRGLRREEAVRSSVGCIHFEDADAMTFTSRGVTVPLNRKLTAYRGRLASTPNAEYQMSTGMATFSHNKETNTLDLYLGFSSVVNIAEAARGLASNFVVGPLDGERLWGPKEEGREKSQDLPEAAALAYRVKEDIPMDFGFLYQPRQEVGCPNKVLEGLAFKAAVAQELMMRGLEGLNALNFLPALLNSYEAVQEQVDCGVEFLRPVAYEHSVAFDTFQSVGLLHTLMEMPGTVMVDAFDSSYTWTSINILQ